MAKRAHEDWCNESTVTGQLQSLLCQKSGQSLDLPLFAYLCAPLLFMNPQQVLPGAKVAVESQALRDLVA